VQPVLDAVVAREVAARLGAGNDVVRAEGVAGVWEGDGEHGRTAVLEGAHHAAEARNDGAVERCGKVFLCTDEEVSAVRRRIRTGESRTHLGDSDAQFREVFCVQRR